MKFKKGDRVQTSDKFIIKGKIVNARESKYFYIVQPEGSGKFDLLFTEEELTLQVKK